MIEKMINCLLGLFVVLYVITVGMELYFYASGDINLMDCHMTIILALWLAAMVVFLVWRTRGW